MTSTAARHLAFDDSGDPEPSGLASQWADDVPPRHAVIDQAPQFQTTPLRVDETLGGYAPYQPAPELQPFDTVANAPVLTVPRDGWGAEPVVALAPEPQPVAYGWTPAAAQGPMPTASVPYPSAPTYPVAPYPSVPGTTPLYAPAPRGNLGGPVDPYAHMPYPNATTPAYGANPYTAMAQQSQTSSGVTPAAVAIGGSVWAARHLVFAIPMIVGLGIITVVGLSMGSRFGSVVVGVAWITGLPAMARAVIKGPQFWSQLRNRRS